MNRWTRRLATGALLSLLSTTNASAEINYRSLDNTQVKGSWSVNRDDTYAITPNNYQLDVTNDGHPDLTFQHGYFRPPIHLSRNGGELLMTAREGIGLINEQLSAIRRLAIGATSGGIFSQIELDIAQADLDNRLDYIDRVATNWMYADRHLLNGESGLSGTTSDPNKFTFVKATRDTAEGSHVVTVDTAAERAFVLAVESQTANLAQDEIISINGMNIQLYYGETQGEVVDEINKYSNSTSVAATIDWSTGKTQLYSTRFGSSEDVWVISNRQAAADSSGFGITAYTDTGTDLSVTTGGQLFSGQGRTVTVHEGLAKGLVIEAAIDSADPTRSIAAMSAATFTVIDQSIPLSLIPFEAAEPLDVTLPRLYAASLGNDIPLSDFESLAAIEVLTPRAAQDSLQVIDAAVREVVLERSKIQQLLNLYYLPQDQVDILGVGSLEILRNGDQVAILQEGELVAGEGDYSGVGGLLTSELLPSSSSGFLGFRFMQDAVYHYGWIRVSLDNAHALLLRDVAFEVEGGRGIRVGYVPEPTSGGLLAAMSWSLLAWRRRSRRNAFATTRAS